MSGKEFTVHYQDGRVDGPISSKVIRDLIASGVVSPQDYVSTGGGPPIPLSRVPEFSDLIARSTPQPQRSAPTGLRPMSSSALRPIPSGGGGGLPSMPGGPMMDDDDDDDVGADATMMMQIPEGGFHPLAIQAEIEARKAAIAAKKAGNSAVSPPPQRPMPRPTPMSMPTPMVTPAPAAPAAPARPRAPQPQEEDLDIFAAAPSVSHKPLLRSGAINALSSSNMGDHGSISIKNPFSDRQQRSSYRQTAQVSGFPESLIRLTSTELRDKLLNMPVHKILGLGFNASAEEAQVAYETRHTQIKDHSDARGSSIIARAAIEDLLNIIEKSRDAMCQGDYQARITQEGDVPFRSYVDFRFAAVKPIVGPIEGPKPMPGQSSNSSAGGPIKSDNSFSANLPTSTSLENSANNPFASGSAANPFTSGNFASPFSGGANASPEPAAPSPARPASTPTGPPGGGNVIGAASFSGAHRAPSVSQEAPSRSGANRSQKNPKKSGTKRKLTKSQRDKKKRLNEFRKAGWGEKGDPFKGHLAFSVGEPKRGLKHVLGLYAIVFIISFVLISATPLGVNEFRADPNELMIYVRNGLLVLTAIIGITVVRRESPDRIGLLPAITPALISIPVACLIALSATPIARLPISPDADLLVVGGLLAIRAIGESVFFHGFVTRTLLIEMREPTHALFLSSLLYGFYALTFVEILGTHPLGIIFGILVYGFGSGFPLAVMYWQTRSVFIPMIAEMIIFIAVAWAGMAHIQTYGVG